MNIYLRLRWSLLLLVILTIGASATAYAQQPPDSLKVELSPIEVTALRTSITSDKAALSFGINSRSLGQLNQEASLSLKSIGDELPGLWVNNRQNYAFGESMTIRGLGWRADYGVRGIQVILDGIPLTVADGQSMTNIIPRSFIRRAELIRGPAASYWGNSSGGVLYLSTVPNYGEGTHARVRSMAGSYGLFKGEGELSISKKKHSINAYSSYLGTDGFRDYSSAKLWRSGVNGKARLTSRSRLEYQAAAVYMPWADQPSSLGAEDARREPTKARDYFRNAGSGKEMTQGQAGLSYILDTSAGLLNISGYGTHRDLTNPLPFGVITVNRWAGGLRASLDKQFDKLLLQGGAESKFQFDDRVEYENIGEDGQYRRGPIDVDQVEQVLNQALFINATYPFGNINLMGSLRYDRLTFSTDSLSTQQVGKRSFQSLSPSISISYTPANYTLFANFSTSFQSPTSNELVNRPDGGNGYNPHLKPEKTRGLEAGIRSQGSGRFTYDLAAYHLWIDDLLFPYQLEEDGPTFFRNQGQTVHMGLEGSASYSVRDDLTAKLTANVTDAVFKKAETLDGRSLKDKQVPGIPDFRLYSMLRWMPHPFQVSVSYEYVNSYAVNNLNSEDNDSYGVVDFKLSFRHLFSRTGVSLQPFLNVSNLMDVRYNGSAALNNPGGRYYEPAPGRHWSAGLALSF